MGHTTIILLVAVFSGTLAGPLNDGLLKNCAERCKPGGINKFNYMVGRSYIYDYEISTKVSLESPGSDSAFFTLKSRLEIGRIGECEFVLRLKDVRVEGESYSREQEIKEQLERNPLRFAYDDGRIDHICPLDDESKWTLNIKRGVLSAFQNSIENLESNSKVTVEETDIAGRCDSDYTITNQEGWLKGLTITKTKNLRTCKNRNSNTSIPSTSYFIQSDFQNLPLFDSEHTCEHSIKDNIIKTITCDETHIFKPFSRKNSGAVTKATLKMVFVKEDDERTTLGYIDRRSTLLFDHSYDERREENREEKVLMILQEICLETKEDVTERTPQLFLNLVRELRLNDFKALQSIDRKINSACPLNEEKIRKYFKDALPMCNTPAAVELMVSKIILKSVTGLEAKGWVLSLGLIQHVNKRMLIAGLNLLALPKFYSTDVLSVSSLVRNFLRHNPRAINEPEVVAIIEILEHKLGYKCKVNNDDEEEKIIVTLTALGNIGDDRTIIHQCYRESSNSLAVRLAAISALRLVNSTAERVLPLVEIFENSEENTEIRIAAYLIAMNSADQRIVERVRRVLENEPVTQVSSFVWTHLTNIQDSSSPRQLELQDIIQEVLQDEKLSRQFDLDGRKFSRFIEKSMFSHTINAGGHVSGKVIFDDSYIPRSASADISVELFGSHISLMGLGVRAMNLEHPIESLFGPQGYFPQNTIHDILKAVGKKPNENNQNRASVKNNRVELFHERFGVKRGEPQGSAYFRLFDNDVLFGRFSGMDDLNSIQEKLKAFDMLLELSKDRDIDYTKNIIFLESSHVTPCLGGLPIKLSMNGTASVNMKISGKVDVRKLWRAPYSCHIEGKLQPSAAVQISATVGIDSFTHQNGIKIKSIFSTSFVLDGKLVVRDGEIFESHLNLPRDKLELFKMSSEMFVVDNHQEKSQRNLEQKRFSKKFCRDIFDMAKICLEGSLVDTFSQNDVPHFPLAGPASLELSLQKMDLQLNQIKLEGKWITPKSLASVEKYAHDIVLSFSTPQTTVQRDLKLDLKITRDKNGFIASIRHPRKIVVVEGSMVDEPERKGAKLSLKIDEKREYAVITEVQIVKKSYSTLFKPLIEFRVADEKPITLQGTALHITGKKLSVDLTLRELTQTPISMKADFEKKPNGDAATNITFTSHILSLTAKGVFFKQQTTYSTQIDAHYRTPKSNKQHRLTMNGKFNNLSTKTFKNYKTTFDLHSNQYPEYNTLVKWDYQQSSKNLENKIELRFGQDQTENNKLEFSQIFSTHDGLSLLLKAIHPKNNIDVNLNLTHQKTPLSLNTNLQVQYDKSKTAGIKLHFTNVRKSVKVVELLLFHTERDIRIIGKVEYAHSQCKVEGTIQYSKGKTISFMIDLKDKTTMNEINHELTARFIPESGIEHSVSYFFNIQHGLVVISTYLERAKKRIYGVESRTTYEKYHMIKSKSLLILNEETSAIEFSYTFKDDNKRMHKCILNLDSHKTKIHCSLIINMLGDKFYDPVEAELMVDVNGDKMEFTTSTEASFARGDRNIRLNAYLITPFRNLRNLKLTTNYKDNGKKLNAAFTSIWDNDRKIELSLDGEYKLKPFELEGKVQFISPYTEDLLIHLKQKYQIRESDSLVRYIYGPNINKKLEISGKYIHDPTRAFRALVSLTSDGSSYPELYLSLKHNGDNKKELTEFEISRNEDKIILNNMVNKQNKNRYLGETKIETPFKNFLKVNGKYSLELSSTKFENKVDVSWGKESDKKAKYVIEFLRNDYKKIQGKAFALVPMLLEDQVDIKLNLNSDTKVLKGNISIKWKPLKEVLVNYIINKENNRFRDGTFSFISPFENYEHLKLNAAYNNDDKLFASGKVEWAPNKIIEIKADHKNGDDRNFETSASLKSPFQDFEDLNLNAKYEILDDKYFAKGEFGWAPNKRIEVMGNLLSIDYFKKIKRSISFKSPFEDFEDLNFNKEFENIDDKYLSKWEFKWAPDKKLEFNSNHRYDGSRKFETSISLKSPSEEIELRGDYRFDDPTKFDSSLSVDSKYLNIKDWHGQIKVEEDGNDYKAKAEYSYDSDKILIEVRHRYEENPCTFEGDIIMQTPYEDLKSAKVKYGHTHEKRDDTNNELIVEVNGREKINLKIKDDNNDKNQRVGNIVFQNALQPFSGSYKFLSKSSPDVTNYKLIGEICLEIICNEKSLKFDISGERGNKVLRTIIKFERPQNRIVRYEMLLDWKNKYNGEVNLEYPERTVVLTVLLEKIYKKTTSSAELKWDAGRNEKKRIGYKFNYEDIGDDSTEDLRTDIIVLTPRKDLVLRSKYTSDDNAVNIQLEGEFLNIPGKIFILTATLRDESPNSLSSNNRSLTLEYVSDDKLSMNFQSHYGWSPQRATSGLVLVHASPNQKRNNVVLWGEVNENDKTIFAVVKIPDRTIETTVRFEDISSTDDSILKLNFETAIDGKKAGKAELLYDESKKTVAAKVFYDLDENKMFHAYGQLVNNTFARFEAYRKTGNERTNDIQGTFSLQRAKLMNSHINWRPEVTSELKEQVQNLDVSIWSYDRISEFYRDSYDEVKNRFESASLRAKEFLRPSYDDISNDANKIFEELKEHYDTGKLRLDDFYSESFRDLVENIKERVENIKERMTDMLESTQDIYQDYTEWMKINYDIYRQRVIEAYNDYKPSEFLTNIGDRLRDNYSSWCKTVSDLFRDMGNTIKEYWPENNWYYDGRDQIQQFLEKHVSRSDLYSKMTDLASNAANSIEEVRDQISEVLEPVTRRISRAADKMTDKYEEMKFNVRTTFKKYYTDLTDREDFKYIRDSYNQILENINIREFLIQSYDVIYNTTGELANNYYEDNYKSQISFDTDVGKFTMTNPLLLEWKDFTSLPDTSSVIKYTDYMREKYDEVQNYSFWDTFYYYRPTPDIGNWVPPFKALALISEQHIRTFDGRFYDFAGECKYLLASDFVDRNFTLIANYGHQGVFKSVMLMIKEVEIEVFLDSKVKVNGKQLELPYYKDKISIMRDHNLIAIRSDTGVALNFIVIHKIFSLELSGWYFGKTGGLFGTYDNERNNDFMMPDRQMATNVLEFVTSWNTEDSCYFKTNFARTKKAEPDSRAFKQCVELFEKQSSPLRKAFSLEDPRPYLDICLKDAIVSQNRVDEETTFCTAAILYVELARNKYFLPLYPPKSCVKCNHPEDKTFTETDTYRIENNAPNSVDVIYVVEERPCNEDFSKRIDEITKRIEASLNKEGLNNNRYGVIGFGGPNEPHVHTVDGEIFTTDRLISKAVSNLVYDDQKRNGDAFNAIKVAAEQSFRAGVAKIVILVKCTNCDERDMSISYGDIQRIYLEHNIDLHILKKSNLVFKGKTGSSDSIYGISATSVYTKKDDKSSTIGDRDLRKQVLVPKDICVALAQETNGTMFSSEKLFGINNAMTFLNVFSKAIAYRTKPAHCQICDCVLDEGYSGKTVCRICDVPKPVIIEMSLFGSADEKVEGKDKVTTTPKPKTKKPQKNAANKKVLKSSFSHDDESFFEFFADDFEWMN